MKFLILGDVHGCWGDMNVTIARALRRNPDITHIVQVGDYGYGSWPHSKGKPFVASKSFFGPTEMELYNNVEKLWIDGNHENFDQLEIDKGAWQPGWTYMPRGSVIEVDGYRVMFFGGAASIDKAHRVEGSSWWRQEDITYRQVQETIDSVDGNIDALFSHEHAESIPYSDVRYKHDHLESKSNRKLLQAIVDNFQPSFCFFGHHHHQDKGMIGGMEWACCPIIESRLYTIWTGTSIITDW